MRFPTLGLPIADSGLRQLREFPGVKATSFRKKIAGYLQYAPVLLMAALFVPACRWVHIRPTAPDRIAGYLFAWFVGSVMRAALLYQIGVSGAWPDLRRNPRRFLYAIPMFVLLLLVFGWWRFVGVSIICVAILEFYHRRGSWKQFGQIVGVWVYLAVGIVLAIEFQAVVVCVRGYDIYDRALLKIDSVLLLGGSVSAISHSAAALFPAAEVLYYYMFAIIGVGIIFLCLAGEPATALRMSNGILVAYICSTVCFAIWPSAGPFSLCIDHLAHFPRQSITLPQQQFALASAAALWRHRGNVADPAMYFISFPAMHVTIPLIVIWFLRRWRRVAIILLAYTVLLVPAILILEWHYFVDILGGLGVAAVAVWLIHLSPKPLQWSIFPWRLAGKLRVGEVRL
jgi:hypothetical protein